MAHGWKIPPKSFIRGLSIHLPSGKHTKSYWKSPFIVNFPMIPMVIFHSYVSLPKGIGKLVGFSHEDHVNPSFTSGLSDCHRLPTVAKNLRHDFGRSTGGEAWWSSKRPKKLPHRKCCKPFMAHPASRRSRHDMGWKNGWWRFETFGEKCGVLKTVEENRDVEKVMREVQEKHSDSRVAEKVEIFHVHTWS